MRVCLGPEVIAEYWADKPLNNNTHDQWARAMAHIREVMQTLSVRVSNLRFLPELSRPVAIPIFINTGTNNNSQQQVSMATWKDRESDKMFNPWLDVASLVRRVTQAGSGPFFSFNNLPVEILQHLAGFLPKGAAAALALTSKGMYMKLGRQYFKDIDEECRWDFLLLLERDCDFFVACRVCRTLHSPFTTSFRRDHPLKGKCTATEDYVVPHGITPAYCRLLARRFLNQESYTDVLGQGTQTKSSSLPDIKIFHKTTPKIVDGRLLVKEETFIAPLCRAGGSTTGVSTTGETTANSAEAMGEGTSKTPTTTPFGTFSSRAAYILNDLTRPFHGAFLCPHLEWCHLGLELVRSMVDNSRKTKDKFNPFIADHRYATGHIDADTTHSSSKRRRRTHHQTHQCSATLEGYGTHIPACYTATALVPADVLETVPDPAITCALLHVQPCAKAKCVRQMSTPRRMFNLVRSCALCATDMCVGVQDDVGDEDNQGVGKAKDEDKGKGKGKAKATDDASGYGRIITLTTWKDLGGVFTNQWPCWDSHYANVLTLGRVFQSYEQVYREIIGRGSDGIARVYAAFEGVEVDREGEVGLDVALPSFYRATVTPQIRRRWIEGAERDGEDSWGFAVPFFSERYL